MKKAFIVSSLGFASASQHELRSFHRNSKAIREQAKKEKLSLEELQSKFHEEMNFSEELLDKDGKKIDIQYHDEGNVFEISYHNISDASYCSEQSAYFTEGMYMDRCLDGIWDWDTDGHGLPESEMYVKPLNGGFPIYKYYDGHGCDENNLYAVGRVPKVDFGFPGWYHPIYSCVTGQDYFGNSQTQKARWRSDRHRPNYDSVIFESSKSHVACVRENVLFYEVGRSGICHQVDNTKWEKMEVLGCGSDDFMVKSKRYSDNQCTNMIDFDEHDEPEICKFDVEVFKEVQYWGWGPFEYSSKYCHKKVIIE